MRQNWEEWLMRLVVVLQVRQPGEMGRQDTHETLQRQMQMS